MNEWQRQQADRLEKRGYLPQLRELASNMAAPFVWSAEPNSILHSGTLCLLKTPRRRIGVTANHVYKSYLEDLNHIPGIEAQFGGTTVYPEKRLIDSDEKLDLATFDVPELMVLPPRFFHEPAWPPRRIEPKDVVLYGGFPGVLKELKPGEIVTPFQSFIWRVTDIATDSMVMNVDFANLYWPGHSAEEKISKNPGGVSGGPVYRVIEADIDRLEIVGFIFEYYEPWETMRARHIERINPDGTICH